MSLLQTPDGPKYYGIYLGTVVGTDEKDPPDEVAGKLKIRVPVIHGQNARADELPWAYPCFPSTCEQGGFIDIPEINSWALVAFQDGDSNAPIWLGCWLPANRFPRRAKYGQGFAYPKIKLWRTSQGQMIRMITGECVEIYAGNNDKVTVDPVTGRKKREPGSHREWDTYISMDLVRKRMTIKSKYPINIDSADKVKVKGTDIDVIAAVSTTYSGNPIADIYGNDASGMPVFSGSVGSKLTLRCSDSTGNTARELKMGPAGTGFSEITDPDGTVRYVPITVGSSITMTPTEIRARARKVRGFGK